MPFLIVQVTFSYNVSFNSLWLCHKSICVHLLPPPDYWYTSCLLSGRSSPPTRIAVSAFSRSPLGRVDAFSFQPLVLTSRMSLIFLPPSSIRCNTINSLSLLFCPLFYLCPVPPTLLHGQGISCWLYAISFDTYRLRYPTLFQLSPFWLVSTVQRYLAMTGNPSLLACSIFCIAISTFSRPFLFEVSPQFLTLYFTRCMVTKKGKRCPDLRFEILKFRLCFLPRLLK